MNECTECAFAPFMFSATYIPQLLGTQSIIYQCISMTRMHSPCFLDNEEMIRNIVQRTSTCCAYAPLYVQFDKILIVRKHMRCLCRNISIHTCLSESTECAFTEFLIYLKAHITVTRVHVQCFRGQK